MKSDDMSMPDFDFCLSTPRSQALRDLLMQVVRECHLNQDITAYLAGGMAVHLYLGERVTDDADMEWSKRILLPPETATLSEGRLIYLDLQYNPMYGLMHESYQDDALPVPMRGIEPIELKVLAPVDLVMSKLPRMGDNDKEDICALYQAGLFDLGVLERRSMEALSYYIGRVAEVEANLRDVIALLSTMRPRSAAE